jgi:apolipoprotein N-acyltransferase
LASSTGWSSSAVSCGGWANWTRSHWYLIPVQAAFFAVYGWWLSGYSEQRQGKWIVLAVGGWSVMELIRYHFPVGGMEWGAAGYALSDNLFARQPAAMVGTSGLTVLVVTVAAGLAVLLARRGGRAALWAGAAVVVVMSVSYSWLMFRVSPT